MASFDIDGYLAFPPMFTLQPALKTQEEQLKAWSQILSQHCIEKKQTSVTLFKCPIFTNAQINRTLSLDARVKVIEFMTKKGNAIWTDKSQGIALVSPTSIAELSETMYQHVCKFELFDTIYTIYEIRKGDIAVDTIFFEIPAEFAYKAIQRLSEENKAEIFSGTEIIDQIGFKFSRIRIAT